MSQTYDYGDYNRGGMIAFTVSMVFTLVFFFYVAFVHQGVDLKEIPSASPQVEEAAPAPEGEAASAPEEGV